MAYEIILTEEAKAQLKQLRAVDRGKVGSAIDQHLRFEPKRESKSRIKRLRRISSPQYRLRVDELRVYYDVEANEVRVIAVVPKAASATWLETHGTADPAQSPEAKEDDNENN